MIRWIEVYISQYENEIRKKAWCNWCGAEAGYMVSRESVISGNRYTDPACHKDASEWATAPDAELDRFSKKFLIA